MSEHKGMRPQDVVVLLKILARDDGAWFAKDLAIELGISNAEVSDSLNRSVIAGLIAPDKRTVMKGVLLDFLTHGLPRVFPQLPGPLQRGMPTAHAAPVLAEHIASDTPYVWPHPTGKVRGQSIVPLHRNVPAACERDPVLYDLLALADALRAGRVRERALALDLLKQRLS